MRVIGTVVGCVAALVFFGNLSWLALVTMLVVASAYAVTDDD